MFQTENSLGPRRQDPTRKTELKNTRDQTAYDAHYKEKHEPAKKPPMKVSQREPTPTPEPSKEPAQEPDKEPTPEPQSGQVTDLSQSVISTGAATSEN